MEAGDGPINNAKVIVQFTDPSNLFDDVAPLLQNRLPLGNLHWKPATRPLRSIEELDVSLDCEVKQDADGANSTRRHQIPGLRQTPFVRVLLLRCDDKDKYKETVRKEVKEWVKGLGFSTSGKGSANRQERHDAYEYLILHVVLPGTPAAAQPKSSKHISAEATESTDSVNSKSKWTGKGASTIFDKLRADFSSSSKAPFERVAQIRLLDSSKPSTALSPLELEQQWQDLIEKLKIAILQSFDVRVAQYEDDIKERESQQNLPGWNFCTFFILKEGLAKGFENVGLLEDALLVYEELDLGLDNVIQNQARADSDTTNVLLPFAVDLKDTIRTVLERNNTEERPALALSLQAWVGAEANRFPWRLERRDYQRMVLTNQVSVLDFRIYIFIRQIQILLRQASISGPAPRSKSANRQSGPRWDADLLSEICERSVKFMNLAARNLRQDLFAAWGGQEGLSEHELRVQKVAIDNIVASWKWSSLLQTLAECQIINSLSTLSLKLHGNSEQGEFFSPTDIANSRTRANSTSTLGSEKMANDEVPDIFAALRIVKGSKSELLFQAAELFTMLRTVLLQLCKQTGLLGFLQQPMVPVASHDNGAWTGILAPSLRSILQSEEMTIKAYKLLTVCACQCYTSAGKPKASRQLLFELAKLEMHNQDHTAAADWLDAIPGFLESPPETWMETSMLKVYISCLRQANRNTDLVKCLLLHIQASSGKVGEDVQQTWEEMIGLAKHDEIIELPFDAIFELGKIDNFITPSTTEDTMLLRLVIEVKAPMDKLGNTQISLECQSRGSSLPSNLLFEYGGELVVANGHVHVELSCPISTEGWYDIVSLRLACGNVIFRKNLRQSPLVDDDEAPRFTREAPAPSIYLYRRNYSPRLEATQSALTDLSAKRGVSINVYWGSNNIATARLRLRPATAGLRLDIQSAVSSEDTTAFSILRQEESHVLEFRDISAEHQTRLEMPYTLDDPSLLSISIRAELTYTSGNKSFGLYDTLSIMILLPLSVNVQDVFQRDAIFSRFTFSPSRLVPMSIRKCQLQGSAVLNVLDGETWNGDPVDAFPKQPVSWVVRITKNSHGQCDKVGRKQLVLGISYQCYDEIILNTITRSLEAELANTAYLYALRPLRAHLRDKLQTLWTEAEIELCALTGEVEMWSFDMLDWGVILHAFDRSERRGLEARLRMWHEKTLDSPLSLRSEGVMERALRLTVDPPETQVIITTQLQTSSRTCIIGQPMMAKLVVAVKSFQLEEELEKLHVSIEVPSQSQNAPENWLIGGQRKAIFRASASIFEGRIILVPQKTGFLLLPGVEVRCRFAGERADESVAFETEHMSAATSVHVRSAIESTTLGVGDGEGTEGHWLVSATRAHE